MLDIQAGVKKFKYEAGGVEKKAEEVKHVPKYIDHRTMCIKGFVHR